MKKVIKFLCLLLIAALIAILVLKNGAKAADVGASVSENTIEVDGIVILTVEFPESVIECHGTFSCSGGGEVTNNNSEYALDYTGEGTKTPSFSLKGVTAGSTTISFSFPQETVSFEGGEVNNEPYEGSITVTVNDKEQEKPRIKISINREMPLNIGDTANISVEVYPDDDTVTYNTTSNPESGVIDFSEDSGSILAVGAGTATITATSSSGVSDEVSITVNGGETPEELTLTPEHIDLIIGGESSSAGITAENKDVTWSIKEGESVVQLNDRQSRHVVVVAISEGNATIVGTTSDGESKEVSITVKNKENPDPGPGPEPEPDPGQEGKPPELSTSSITLNAGGESATIRVTNDVPVDWTSDKPNVVAIAGNHTDTETAIISDNPGKATITATAKNGGKIAEVSVTVSKNEQAAPEITPPGNIRLEVGRSVFLSANQGVNWSSGNSSVASVSSDGTVTAKGVGETRITATNGSGKSSSVTVTVVQASNGGGSGNGSNPEEPANPDQGTITTDTFEISPTKTQTLNIGDTLQIKVTKGTASSWKSSKPAVATVDNNGKVTANSAGTTIITAVASDGSVAQVKVRVRDENGEVPEPDSESNTDVPSTGEASTELLLVLGVLTCVIAMFIFRKKTK